MNINNYKDLIFLSGENFSNVELKARLKKMSLSLPSKQNRNNLITVYNDNISKENNFLKILSQIKEESVDEISKTMAQVNNPFRVVVNEGKEGLGGLNNINKRMLRSSFGNGSNTSNSKSISKDPNERIVNNKLNIEGRSNGNSNSRNTINNDVSSEYISNPFVVSNNASNDINMNQNSNNMNNHKSLTDVRNEYKKNKISLSNSNNDTSNNMTNNNSGTNNNYTSNNTSFQTKHIDFLNQYDKNKVIVNNKERKSSAKKNNTTITNNNNNFNSNTHNNTSGISSTLQNNQAFNFPVSSSNSNNDRTFIKQMKLKRNTNNSSRNASQLPSNINSNEKNKNDIDDRITNKTMINNYKNEVMPDENLKNVFLKSSKLLEERILGNTGNLNTSNTNDNEIKNDIRRNDIVIENNTITNNAIKSDDKQSNVIKNNNNSNIGYNNSNFNNYSNISSKIDINCSKEPIKYNTNNTNYESHDNDKQIEEIVSNHIKTKSTYNNLANQFQNYSKTSINDDNIRNKDNTDGYNFTFNNKKEDFNSSVKDNNSNINNFNNNSKMNCFKVKSFPSNNNINKPNTNNTNNRTNTAYLNNNNNNKNTRQIDSNLVVDNDNDDIEIRTEYDKDISNFRNTRSNNNRNLENTNTHNDINIENDNQEDDEDKSYLTYKRVIIFVGGLAAMLIGYNYLISSSSIFLNNTNDFSYQDYSNDFTSSFQQQSDNINDSNFDYTNTNNRTNNSYSAYHPITIFRTVQSMITGLNALILRVFSGLATVRDRGIINILNDMLQAIINSGVAFLYNNWYYFLIIGIVILLYFRTKRWFKIRNLANQAFDDIRLRLRKISADLKSKFDDGISEEEIIIEYSERFGVSYEFFRDNIMVRLREMRVNDSKIRVFQKRHNGKLNIIWQWN